MSLSTFNCPNCRSPFQVDTSLRSLPVACPHCRQPVALISEPPVAEPPAAPPPFVEPPLVQPPVNEPPVVEPPVAVQTVIIPPALDFGTAEPRPAVPRLPHDLLPPIEAIATEVVPSNDAQEHHSITEEYRSRQRLIEERATRKFVKNLIVWICCAIVLVLILAYFLGVG